jgi:hypothetical protein
MTGETTSLTLQRVIAKLSHMQSGIEKFPAQAF